MENELFTYEPNIPDWWHEEYIKKQAEDLALHMSRLACGFIGYDEAVQSVVRAFGKLATNTTESL